MVHRDIFEGLTYSQVRTDHIVEIAYKLIEPVGMPPLVMEVGHFRPYNAPIENTSRHAIVVPPGFGTRMQDKGAVTHEATEEWAPNHHALRHASLARETGLDVIAFGFPYGDKVDSLPRSIRRKIAQGDFSTYIQYIVQELADRGIESIDIDGYSLGGALAPDLALACLEKGIKVNNLFLGAIANADIEAGAVKVAKRKLSGTGNTQERFTYAESSTALKQEVARHAVAKKGLGITALGAVAGKIVFSLKPTPFAFARGVAHGAFLNRPLKDASTDPAQKLLILKNHFGVNIHLYSGDSDLFIPIAYMQRIADALKLPLNEYENETHALRDKLAIINAFIVSKYFETA